MKFDLIKQYLNGIPHIPPEDGKTLYEFILKNKPEKILELGFENGTSTCYMAAALNSLGAGYVTTIDRIDAKEVQPNIFELLEKTKLKDYVTPIFANTSYTWELMKIIENQTKNGVCIPLFDFCFIDGAHTWEVDGMAFYLVDKLLKPNGWILFDDMNWSFSDSFTLKEADFVKNMPEDERTTNQIEKVYTLLVQQHTNYSNFSIHNRWGWAQKKSESVDVKLNTINDIYIQQSIFSDIISILRKIKYRLKKY